METVNIIYHNIKEREFLQLANTVLELIQVVWN